MEPRHTEIHPKFKLNGSSFSKEDLKKVGYSLVKEGDAYELQIGDFLLDWINDKHVITVKTSGSTGTPKRIEIQKRFMVNSSLATARFFDLEAGQSALLCLPTDFIAGKIMLVRAMVLGLELDYVEPSSSPLKNLNGLYDFCAMVPLQLENSLDKIDQIKTLIVGGAPIPFSLQNQVQNKRTAIFETYGMTETVTHIAIRQINGAISNPSTMLNSGSVKSHFKTLRNVTVSQDARGCLVIDCPNIAEQPIITNDVIQLISASEFEWLGRYDTVINSGGIKLYPERIEEKLSTLIAGRFMVVGVPDEKLGQKSVVILEGDVDTERLFQKIKSLKTLERFEVPNEIFKVPKFVETKNGKTQREETARLIFGD